MTAGIAEAGPARVVVPRGPAGRGAGANPAPTRGDGRRRIPAGPRPVRPGAALRVAGGDRAGAAARRSGRRPGAYPRGAQRRAAPPRSGGVARLCAVVVATLAVVGGLGALGQVATGGAAPVPSATTEVRVSAGETLWDVATRVAPTSDDQAVVARIRELNGMTGSALRPGQALQVPDGR